MRRSAPAATIFLTRRALGLVFPYGRYERAKPEDVIRGALGFGYASCVGEESCSCLAGEDDANEDDEELRGGVFTGRDEAAAVPVPNQLSPVRDRREMWELARNREPLPGRR